MTVYDWDGRQLLGSYNFEPTESGFVEFEQFLNESVSMPARLLVDVIEEDFRRETIPHVNIRDRRSLISRLIDRHFRTEDYVHAKILGRSSSGRRDDQVLLSSLTNTSLLSPWLERLQDSNTRLAGIWSVPLLTDKLHKLIFKGEKNSLIVSRQVRSALRNSYFQDGKLMLSRQAKFDKDMWDREDFAGVISNLERGTNEIYNFLINQRIVDTSDELSVHCILPEKQVQQATELSRDTETIHYQFVSLESLFSHFRMRGCEEQGAGALFAFLCSKVTALTDHYATNDQKQTYYQYLVNNLVTQTAEVGSLICITIAVLLALNSMELNLDEAQMLAETEIINQDYEQSYGDIEYELSTANTIQDTVDTVRLLDREAEIAPHKIFPSLGRVLGRLEFAAIKLNKLEWQKYASADLNALIEGYKFRIKEQSNPYGDGYGEEAYEGELEDNLYTRQAVINLKGNINRDGLSYRLTIQKMHDFIDQLRQLEEVKEVLLLRMPVDIRGGSDFTDEIGIEKVSTAKRVGRGAFEVFIVLKADQSA